ncbi:hypothetical protein BDW42DRAFT_195406 [Aspergillus taichungensis]|uniref:C2H2-type domain-containing protein n=1 Tax=Aspergillus taichungensis TaxID=482145 RepID=A0A2J5HPE9_9EURO|nr:hypothetical protein BDW42DRAFT_195406 [Aspergillus taichungensis]
MTASAPGKVRCTYIDCPQAFNSIREMKIHKDDFPEHHYCKRCDEDFHNEESFMIHKLKSTKHVTCPVCGMEFNSEGGRDGHIRQATIVCVGCNSKFKSASSLMQHIEADECEKIPQLRLLHEQSKKLIMKEFLLKGGQHSSHPVIPERDNLDDQDGGVSLAGWDFEAMAFRPKHTTELKDDQADHGAKESANMACEHWPLPGEHPERELKDFHKLSLDKHGNDENDPFHGSLVRPKPRSLKSPQMAGEGANTPNAGQTLLLLDSKWDANRFLHGASSRYMCPCGMSFDGKEEFELHILRKSTATRTTQCPGCLRVFKSTAALIAHCESPSTRCDVNAGSRFPQIIDELSGGVIQMAGFNPDGTVKYEAGKLDLTETTVVGTNLRKW